MKLAGWKWSEEDSLHSKTPFVSLPCEIDSIDPVDPIDSIDSLSTGEECLQDPYLHADVNMVDNTFDLQRHPDYHGTLQHREPKYPALRRQDGGVISVMPRVETVVSAPSPHVLLFLNSCDTRQ